VQLTDLGQGIGARLTRQVANQRLGVSLFGQIGTKVSFIDNGTVYQFASDPAWGRILSGRMNYWVHDYDNRTGPGGRLRQPLGIDISARKYVYAADRATGLIFLATFSPTTENLVSPGMWTAPQFPRPVDVAWDGRTTPLTADYLYVLDDSLGRVTYWDRPTLLWSYGTIGSGLGQFSRPSGVCVGKSAAANGGTQFTRNFYVVDRGNRRVVWLNRGDTGPTWMGSAALPTWDPADCAVDFFGNLYIADEVGHRIHKFTWSLAFISSYGTYGKGAGNLNTLAFPHAISVPCGLKVVNSQTVWYCEGRVITAEAWSDSTGAVEHYLGIVTNIVEQPDPSVGRMWMTYSTTDHASHSNLELFNTTTGHYYIYSDACSLCPPGARTVYWDGSPPPGGPQLYSGHYEMIVRVTSAYGCPSGQAWCYRNVVSAPFWYAGADPPCCDEGPSPGPRAPGEAEPTALFLRQRASAIGRPLARVAGAAASAPDVPATVPTGSLSAFVRQYGMRGLAFAVPRSTSTGPVGIRVYSIAGRLVRTLVNENLEVGYYEIAWDGLDDRGQAAAPGVYFAVLTAGGQRLVKRLILRQAP
jgi:hypothetical protein